MGHVSYNISKLSVRFVGAKGALSFFKSWLLVNIDECFDV